MAILKKKPREGKIIIDLASPKGNAFWLLGYASKLAKQLNLDADKIIHEMKSSNYENLIRVFDSYFGAVIDLER